MAFVPPYFAAFGQRFTNLYDKDSLQEKKLSVNFANNVNDETIESGIDFRPNGDSARPMGFLRRAFPLPYKIGNLDFYAGTDNTFDFNLTNTTALKDFTLTANSGYSSGKSTDGLEGCRLGFGLKHAREYAACFLGLRTAFKSGSSPAGPVLDASVALGAESFSVGGNVSVDTASKEIVKRECGLDWRKGDFACAVLSTEKQKQLQVNVSQQLDSKTLLGAAVDFNFDNNEDGNKPIFSGVAQVKLDSSSMLKLRANSQASVSTDVEYCLSNPKLKLALSATFDVLKRSTETSKWGVTCVLGDY